jgi:Protein of unknown function (DUF4031)
MTVYVDNAQHPFRGMLMSHMLADTDDELRAMAHVIGLQERWHQGDHFDINQEMRSIALANGAKQITQREAVLIRRKFRLSKDNSQ